MDFQSSDQAQNFVFILFEKHTSDFDLQAPKLSPDSVNTPDSKNIYLNKEHEIARFILAETIRLENRILNRNPNIFVDDILIFFQEAEDNPSSLDERGGTAKRFNLNVLLELLRMRGFKCSGRHESRCCCISVW